MQLTLSPEDLKPLVAQVLVEVLHLTGGSADRLAYPEAEAAGLLGINSHVLRDARLRGEIKGSKIGRGYSYTRSELIRWHESRREK